jgi:hypothetical protein
VSFHVGSGCQNVAVYADAIRAARAAFDAAEALGFDDMHLLDVGGGFTAPYDAESADLFYRTAAIINGCAAAREERPWRGACAWPTRTRGRARARCSCGSIRHTCRRRHHRADRTVLHKLSFTWCPPGCLLLRSQSLRPPDGCQISPSLDPTTPNPPYRTIDECFPAGCGVRIIAEPGRYFAETSATLFTTILGQRAARAGAAGGAPAPRDYWLSDGTYGSFRIQVCAGWCVCLVCARARACMCMIMCMLL